eukprot:5975271-Pyramimonas_sp.AAC.1
MRSTETTRTGQRQLPSTRNLGAEYSEAYGTLVADGNDMGTMRCPCLAMVRACTARRSGRI